ncbi:MAG TPA: damage-inducible protein [Planctomycetaceae bacterium]|nr:damage-inducible protein [Planctomycetaceae bacterium]
MISRRPVGLAVLERSQKWQRSLELQSNSIFPFELAAAAQRLADRLSQNQTQVVFAESCTAGLVSASLAVVPGISKWLCGSAVTYQESTKIRWLGVEPTDLEKHSAVSKQVAITMASGVLRATPNADIAVSVTGHLGPEAPRELDAVIFIGTAIRIRSDQIRTNPKPDSTNESQYETINTALAERIVLNSKQRQQRQVEAATAVLLAAAELVEMQK